MYKPLQLNIFQLKTTFLKLVFALYFQTLENTNTLVKINIPTFERGDFIGPIYRELRI